MAARLRLKRHEDRRLRRGHLWIYSNEVDTAATPLKDLEPGAPVVVEDARGEPLGAAYANPHSLICARLVSRDPREILDARLLARRLERVLALRRRLFETPCYRLVHGEGDGLPGLVVDRFGDTLVAQITTAGMERLKEELAAALEALLRPACILLRNDTPVRQLEGLPLYRETVLGETPEHLELEENGAAFRVPALAGQKTGWFYDHRINRARLAAHARGRRVLDVFSYTGGWAVQAARAGAREVLCVDASKEALHHLMDNARRNGVGERVAIRHGEAFAVLKALREEGARFDAVVLDPPAFIKRRKDAKEGLVAYRRLNLLAMQLLDEDGLLVSCSCSYHLGQDQLRDVIRRAGHQADRFVQILEQGHQAPDHPVHPAIAETNYLKAFFARVLPP